METTSYQNQPRRHFGVIQRVNLALALALIVAGGVLDFDVRQRTILGIAGLLSLWAGLTSQEKVNYGINILLGLMAVFSAVSLFR